MILTLLIKLAFYKLSETSYKSMAKLRKITPRMQQIKERYALGEIGIAPDGWRWLALQPWPGNVRELKHCVERAALMSAKPLLGRAELEAVSGAGEIAAADRLDRDVLPLDQVEKLMIGRAMSQCTGNVTRAAELLGLSRAALYRRLAKHGLEPS